MIRPLHDPEVASTVVPAPDGAPTCSDRASQALDEYLKLLESGFAPEVEQFLLAYPELADGLRGQIEALREIHQAAASLQPVSPAMAPRQGWLGSYRLIREIGRGGMGVVFEAEDTTMGRRVALKVLPFAALLNDKQLARFHNEAQAAARLHHPHIVPVFAVGSDRGVHFYAMQFVDGRSLDEAMNTLSPLPRPVRGEGTGAESPAGEIATTAPWPDPIPAAPHQSIDYLRKIATIGRDVALALQHAHETGILHRDIKPSNLMLDHAGHVWVTDFGLARVPGDVGVTSTGDVLGSARYMSPEQAAGRRAFVDHRTDIYSLGITLYELLTLRPAYPSETREQFLRQIEHEDPPSPRRWNAAIPPILESIVLKAIDKDPARRFLSAQELADDLQRFLDGMPTHSHRTRLADRLRRFSRRHRRLVMGIVGMSVVACLGCLIAAWLILQEQHRTQAALAQAKSDFRRAEENYLAARLAVDEFGMKMSERLVGIPGTERVRREMLQKTLHYYQAFIAQSSHDDSFWHDVGVTHLKTGRIYEEFGDLEQALGSYDQACDTLAKVVPRGGSEGSNSAELARAWNNRGLLRSRLGRHDEALADLQRALDLQSRLLQTHPADSPLLGDLACSLCNKAFVLSQANQKDEAITTLREAVRRQRDLVSREPHQTQWISRFAISLHNLAGLVMETDPRQAESLAAEALDLQRKLVQLLPDALHHVNDLSLSLNNHASLLLRHGQEKEAAEEYAEAVHVSKQLVARCPAIVPYQCDLAISVNNLGRVMLCLHEPARARTHFQEACDILEQLVAQLGNQSQFLGSLSSAQFNLGIAHHELGETRSAHESIERAVALQQKACQLAPSNVRLQAILNEQRKVARRWGTLETASPREPEPLAVEQRKS